MAVVGADVEPASGDRDVRAEAVVAGLRVVERQPLDRLVDELDAPRLPAGRGIQPVEESVVGLEEERCTHRGRPRPHRAAGAERPALAAGGGVHRVNLAVLGAGEHEAGRDGRPGPQRRSGVERPRGLAQRAVGLGPRRRLDVVRTPQHEGHAVDGDERLRHHARERLRRRVVAELERAEVHVGALDPRRHAAERHAHQVRRRYGRLQEHLAVLARLELEREGRRFAVVSDRARPRSGELGRQRARGGLGPRLETDDQEEAERKLHVIPPRPPRRSRRRSLRRYDARRRSPASPRACRARAPGAGRARDTPAAWRRPPEAVRR